MDKKDLRILQELDSNSRASYNQIAKKTRISKETVQYRIQKLEEEKIILGYWGLPKIGNDIHVYKIFLKNKGLTIQEKKEFETFITQSPEISWFAQTSGSWTYILTPMSQEDWKISLLLTEIFARFGKYFSDIQMIKSTKIISLNEKYLFDNPNIYPAYDDLLTPPIKLTTTESHILAILTKNAREKYVDIAKQLSLTPEAVSHGFKQLYKKNAIISLKPRINHAKLGFSYYHLMLSFSDGQKKGMIQEYFIKQKNAVFVMHHVGKYQMHVELVCNQEDSNTIIELFLNEFSECISEYDLCKIEKEFKIQVNQ